MGDASKDDVRVARRGCFPVAIGFQRLEAAPYEPGRSELRQGETTCGTSLTQKAQFCHIWGHYRVATRRELQNTLGEACTPDVAVPLSN